jgi:hypothetical protein
VSERYHIKRAHGIPARRKDGSYTSPETDEQSTPAEEFSADQHGGVFNREIYATHGDRHPNYRLPNGLWVNAVWAGWFDEENRIPRTRGNLIINVDDPGRYADIYESVVGSLEFGFRLNGWATHEELTARPPRPFGFGPKYWMPFEDLHWVPFGDWDLDSYREELPPEPEEHLFCSEHRSHYCPCVAAHLYTRPGELAAAMHAWDLEAEEYERKQRKRRTRWSG